jgi:hypothetical protein
MAQLGHTDPKFTLRIYAHVMRRGARERLRLRRLVGADSDSANLDLQPSAEAAALWE